MFVPAVTPLEVPASVTVPTVVVACLVPVAGLWCAGFGARSARLERPLRLAVAPALALAGWGALVVLFAENGVLWGEVGSLTGVWIPLAWLLPMLGMLWALRRLPRLREALGSRAGMAWLAYTQVARNLGLVFLILHGRGQLPGLFAYPAVVGDVVAGVTAPVVAWALAFRRAEVLRRGSPWRTAVVAWNVFGVAEHAVAVGLGTVLFPGPLQLIDGEPSTALFAGLPLVLFPAYLVCFADAVHLFILDVLTRRSPVAAPPSSLVVSSHR